MPSQKKKGRAAGSGDDPAPPCTASAVLQAVLGNNADALEQLIRGVPATALNSRMRVPPQGLTADVVTMEGKKLELFLPPSVGAVAPLELAVDNGHRDCVEVLLRAGVAPNGSIPETQAGGSSPLSRCLFGNRMFSYLDCVLLLLEAGATSHEWTLESGATVLSRICQNGPEDWKGAAARLLIMHGADINRPKCSGATPLYSAAQNGCSWLVRLLVYAGADIDRPFQSGATPLSLATGNGHLKCVQRLLAARADAMRVAHHDDSTPVKLAIMGLMKARLMGDGDVRAAEKIKQLLDTEAEGHALGGSELRPGELTTIHGLAGRADLNGLPALVAGEYDSASGRYPIVTLVDKGGHILSLSHGESVRVRPANLLMRGDPQPSFGKLLPPVAPAEAGTLLSTGQPRTFCKLLSQQPDLAIANVTVDGGPSGLMHLPMLQIAIAIASPDASMCVRALLAAGAPVDTLLLSQDVSVKNTVLQTVSAKGDPDVVRVLLEHKADVDHTGSGGKLRQTALMQALGESRHASSQGRVQCIRLLLDHGADVNKRDGADYTPLLAAAEWGTDKAMRLLLRNGADLNSECVAEGRGYTPLIAAASCRHVACVKMLLEAGADTSIAYFPPRRKGYPFKQMSIRDLVHHGIKSADGGAMKAIKKLLDSPQEKPQPQPESSALDKMFKQALVLGASSKAEISSEKERLKARQVTEKQLLATWKSMLDEWTLTRPRRMMVSRILFQHHVSNGTASAFPEQHLLPMKEVSVGGGRVRIGGLAGPGAEFNGREATISSWNTNGRRQFAVTVEADGANGASSLMVSPHNLSPLDGDHCHYPSGVRVNQSSAEVVAQIKAAFASSGIIREVHDWTSLASDQSIDVVNLHFQGLHSPLLALNATALPALTGTPALKKALEDHDPSKTDRAVYYVQRTRATEGFFLAHRELLNGDEDDRYNGNVATPPWLLFYHGGILLPPAWERTCDAAFIARMARVCSADVVECTVCLEETSVASAPSQLPCMHFLCPSCTSKLFLHLPKGAGCTCPTCKTHFASYACQRKLDSPGGVSFVERPCRG